MAARGNRSGVMPVGVAFLAATAAALGLAQSAIAQDAPPPPPPAESASVSTESTPAPSPPADSADTSTSRPPPPLFGTCSDDDGDDDVHRKLDRTFRADAGRRSGHPDHAGDHHDVDSHDVDRDEAGLRSHDRLRGGCERGQARGPRPGDHDSAGHTGGNRSPSSSGGCGAGSDAAFRFAPRPVDRAPGWACSGRTDHAGRGREQPRPRAQRARTTTQSSRSPPSASDPAPQSRSGSTKLPLSSR